MMSVRKGGSTANGARRRTHRGATHPGTAAPGRYGVALGPGKEPASARGPLRAKPPPFVPARRSATGEMLSLALRSIGWYTPLSLSSTHSPQRCFPMAKLTRRAPEHDSAFDPTTDDPEEQPNGATQVHDDPVLQAIEQMKEEPDLLKLKAWLEQVQLALDDLRTVFAERATALVSALGLSVPPAQEPTVDRVVERAAVKPRAVESNGAGGGAIADAAVRVVNHMKRNKMKDAPRSKLQTPLDLSEGQIKAALKYAVDARMLTKQGDRGSTRYNLP
jgi:hypothetical protein